MIIGRGWNSSLTSRKLEDLPRLHRYRNWAAQLSHSMTKEELRLHPRKSIRSIDEMESIGAIAEITRDKTWLEAVDSLYGSAKKSQAIAISLSYMNSIKYISGGERGCH